METSRNTVYTIPVNREANKRNIDRLIGTLFNNNGDINSSTNHYGQFSKQLGSHMTVTIIFTPARSEYVASDKDNSKDKNTTEAFKVKQEALNLSGSPDLSLKVNKVTTTVITIVATSQRMTTQQRDTLLK